MERVTITENALLEALRQARSVETDATGALTVVEISEAVGTTAQTAGRWVRALSRTGVIECVRKPCVGIDGVTRPQPAYRMKAA